VISREAMPMTTVMAAANMTAPITSNRISVKDIAHQAMRPQPAVTAGACSNAREDDDRARMLRGEGRSGAIHKQRWRDSGRLRASCGLAPQPIRKSSRSLPALISAPSQSGMRPRPDQTSSAFLGLRYFAAIMRVLA
jgi:hypothetical protein